LFLPLCGCNSHVGGDDDTVPYDTPMEDETKKKKLCYQPLRPLYFPVNATIRMPVSSCMLNFKAIPFLNIAVAIAGAVGVYMVCFASFESHFVGPGQGAVKWKASIHNSTLSSPLLAGHNPAEPIAPLGMKRTVSGSDDAATEYLINGTVYQRPLHHIGDALLNEGLRDLPLPLLVVEQYVRWHSVEALRRDPSNRMFAVGYYACPTSAGSRIHEFANGKVTVGPTHGRLRRYTLVRSLT